MAEDNSCIDFSKLGFEIICPRHDTINCPCNGEAIGPSQIRKPCVSGQDPSVVEDQGPIDVNITDSTDEVSAFDVDSAYGSEYTDSDDEDDPPFAYEATELNDPNYQKEDTCHVQAVSHPSYDDLGYRSFEPVRASDPGPSSSSNLLSQAQLGYDDDHHHPTCRHKLLHGTGARRSADMRRRLSSMGRRHSTNTEASSSSVSSCSCKKQEKRVVDRSKSGEAHRERLVIQSRRRFSLAACDGKAVQQILEDLGCSSLLVESRLQGQRAPRRVSLEYASCGSIDARRPKSISLDFGEGSSTEGSFSRTRMPRRVSIGYDQEQRLGSKQTIRRRGSLDYSVRTSALPRRGSLGKDFKAIQHQSDERKQSLASSCYGKQSISRRRNSLGRHALVEKEIHMEEARKKARQARFASRGSIGLSQNGQESASSCRNRQTAEYVPCKPLSARRLSIQHF